jgi:hypothetical protein
VRLRIRWTLGLVVSVALVLALVVLRAPLWDNRPLKHEVTRDAAVAASGKSSLTEPEAMEKAIAIGKPVVVDTLTTPTQMVKAVPGKGYVAEITAVPTRVQTAEGWQDADPTFLECPICNRLGGNNDARFWP